jgi:predicted DNA-binding transcriptional regulator YafY
MQVTSREPPTLSPVARVDRLERLTDLVLVLLNTTRPLSLRELADAIPGFPPEGEARRQAFERDKRTLRDQGIAVVTEPIDGPEQIGYRIRPEDFYLPDLDLEPDEQAALNVAVAEVHVGDPSGRDALWRLGIPSPRSLAPVAALPSLPALPGLFEAVRSRSHVSFGYRGETREVDPGLLRFRQGRWYLVGLDRDRGAPRTFRVDRIEGIPIAAERGSGALPDDFDAEGALPDEPWKVGEDEIRPVRVLVDALEGPRVVQELGVGSVSETHPDGSVEVSLEVSNEPALVSWVLSLGPHAEILEPTELRDGIVAWLRGFVGVAEGG